MANDRCKTCGMRPHRYMDPSDRYGHEPDAIACANGIIHAIEVWADEDAPRSVTRALTTMAQTLNRANHGYLDGS